MVFALSKKFGQASVKLDQSMHKQIPSPESLRKPLSSDITLRKFKRGAFVLCSLLILPQFPVNFVQPLLTHTHIEALNLHCPHTLSAIKVNLLQHFKSYTGVKPVM